MLEGIVNILKPPGMTSSDVVSDVRRIYNTRRVGHTGTLDPGAAGVLPVCIGRATRLFDLLVDKEKEYIAEITFGIETDTQDSYGKVTERCDAVVSEADLISVLPRFVGEIEQIAPMYSAVRVDGKKLYELARAGAETVEKKRSITVKDISILGKTGENKYLVSITCSKGTYVRTLCADIGRALGTCAHMSFLLRVRSGAFSVQDAYTIAELREIKEQNGLEETLVSVEDALYMLETLSLELDDTDMLHFKNGAEITGTPGDDYPVGKQFKTYANGEFMGIGERTEEGIHIKVNFMALEDGKK